MGEIIQFVHLWILPVIDIQIQKKERSRWMEVSRLYAGFLCSILKFSESHHKL